MAGGAELANPILTSPYGPPEQHFEIGRDGPMAMLIAWQTVNKVANPRDTRFAKRFLVVAPGITIRDRLRVIQPSDPGNYYKARDLLPPDLWHHLHQAEVTIVNRHVFETKTAKELRGVASALDRDDTRVARSASRSPARRTGPGRLPLLANADDHGTRRAHRSGTRSNTACSVTSRSTGGAVRSRRTARSSN